MEGGYLDPPRLAQVHQDLQLQIPVVPKLELEVIAKGCSPKQCLVISVPLRASPAITDNHNGRPRRQPLMMIGPPYPHSHVNRQSPAPIHTHLRTQSCAEQQQQRSAIWLPLAALHKSWAPSWHPLVVCGQYLLLFVLSCVGKVRGVFLKTFRDNMLQRRSLA